MVTVRGRFLAMLALLLLAGAVVACTRPSALPAPPSAVTSVTHAPTARAGALAVGDLAIVLDKQIVVRSLDNHGPDSVLITLTTPATYPAFPVWSPDGAQLAYVEKHFPTGLGVDEDWGDDIQVVPATGGAPRLVHRHRALSWQAFGLAWTADGSALVFGDVRPTFENGRFVGSTARLTRIDLTTGDERLLLDHASLPSFSGDGKRLAYMDATAGFGTGGLWVADGDGANPRPVVTAGTFGSLLFPRLSPDGTAIVFSASDRIGARPQLAPAAQPRTLLATLLHAFMPASAAAHGLPMDIWVADVTSGTLTRITNLYEDDPCPAWSSDGREIIAMGLRGLYRIAPDGSSTQQLGPGAFGAQLDLRRHT